MSSLDPLRPLIFTAQMDPNFSFPRLPAPTLRPRPIPKATASPEADNSSLNNERDSNALRASVLDVALQLGLGTNNAVAHWMFSNSLEEEAEEVGILPSLIPCGWQSSTHAYFSSTFIPTPTIFSPAYLYRYVSIQSTVYSYPIPALLSMRRLANILFGRINVPQHSHVDPRLQTSPTHSFGLQRPLH